MFPALRRKFSVDFTNPKNLSRIDKSMLKPFLSVLTERIKTTEQADSLRLKSLYYYRRLLIAVNGCYESNIHVQNKIEELKFTFYQNSNNQSAGEIKLLHDMCQDILNKIESGIYPPFPETEENLMAWTEPAEQNNNELKKYRISNLTNKDVSSLGGQIKGDRLEEEMMKTGMRID